jgi:hypothetical protein
VDTAPKASGCILGGTQRIHREEPGKQKPGSCWAQELSRSRAQGMERGNGNNNPISCPDFEADLETHVLNRFGRLRLGA